MRVENEVTIDASIDEVWALTIDVESWPSFMDTVTSVKRLDDGPLGLGSKAAVRQPGLGERVWTVSTWEPKRKFAWETRILGARMVGIHELEPLPDGRCRNLLAVEVTGFTSWLLGALIGRRGKDAIAAENASTKRQAERVS